MGHRFTYVVSLEHSELDGGFIRYDTHLSTQSIDFAHNLILCQFLCHPELQNAMTVWKNYMVSMG